MVDRMELLRLIENNSRLSAKEIAVMLECTEAQAAAELKALYDEKIILGYTTQINWEKTERETVIAMIEVKMTPMRNKGYDHVANILCKYDKVSACYLMSGGSDLMLIYEDRNLRDVASFVSDKVAPLEGVLSTTTHFILKKYKTNGIVYDRDDGDNRQAIVL